MLPEYDIGVVILANTDEVDEFLIELAYYSFDMLLNGDSWVTPSIICESAKQEKFSPQNDVPGRFRSSSNSYKRPKDSYASTYKHPTFGTITVWLDESNNLLWEYESVTGILSPIRDNFFWANGTSSIYPGTTSLKLFDSF